MLRSFRVFVTANRAFSLRHGSSKSIIPGAPPTGAALEIAALVDRSRIAHQKIENYTQEQVDDLIRAMVWAVCQQPIAEKIAQHTIDETKLGNYAGKYLKIFKKTRAALFDIIDDKSMGIIEEDHERQVGQQSAERSRTQQNAAERRNSF
jgi:hypothetical protein